MTDQQNHLLGQTSRIRHEDGWAHKIELPAVHLTVTRGPDAGYQVTDATPTLRIGSDPQNDLVLTDPSVSRTHARLSRTAKGLLLTDLDSTNGTFVNDVRTREAFVTPGQEIRLGETVIRVEDEVQSRFAIPGDADRCGGLVGGSAPMREVYALLECMAPTPSTVLIRGESGTGKEVVARTLHELSGRSGPFVTFDCATTSPDLIRSELFGHRSGAFTGAADERTGAFRMAQGGTLFVDELQALPLELQPQFLRALEAREVQPLGMDRPVPIDVRVVAATNEDLHTRVEAGSFRLDLYHRVRILEIDLPPLRDRTEDIPLLVEHLGRGLPAPVVLDASALDRLRAHAWPGNVRELRNVLERLSVLCRDRTVTAQDVIRFGRLDPGAGPVPGEAGPPPPSSGTSTPEPAAPGAIETLEDAERRMIIEALEKTEGNRTRAAELLGIGVATLRRKLRSYRERGLFDDGNG